MSDANTNKPKSEKKGARTAADKKRTRITILVASLVVVLVGVIAGVAIYQNRVRPFNTVIISVNDTEIDMRYFLKRLAMSENQSYAMLGTLSEEAMLREAAPKPPYNIEVTEEDIDNFARDLAKGSDDTIEESEFREWYRQRVNATRLSENEFRELLKTGILRIKMTEYLEDQVPEEMEQVYLHMIVVEDMRAGNEVKERFEEGEDFAALSDEFSVDQSLKQNDGELGWFPQAALEDELAYTAFDLEVGECSDPVFIGDPDDETIAVIMVSDKQVRQIEERAIAAVKDEMLQDWFKDQYHEHDVQFYGLDRTTGYDSGTDAWVNWQLMRMKRGEQQQQQQQQG